MSTYKQRADIFYSEIPDHIKEDLCDSILWAKNFLTHHEGGGHDFQISTNANGEFCCSFAKPEWSGDHSGRYMLTVPEAIVMSVCEYLSGV